MDRDGLFELLEPTVEGLGFELVALQYSPGHGHGFVRLYIDQADGVDVEDCARVSEQVGALLDVEDPIQGHYTLEVSSPGADRPLRTAAHFERFKGEQAKVELARALDGRKRFKGAIVEVAEQEIVLDVDGERFSLPIRDIDMARLIPGRD